MVTWIVLGALLVGLLLLAVAARRVLVRLPQLRRALALHQRQAQAEGLRHAAIALEERVAAVQRQVDETQRRVAVLRARRGGSE